MPLIQAELFAATDLATCDARDFFSEATAESRGAVHTRPVVAEFILDLAGWQTTSQLPNQRLLEPSCGEGDFLLPAVRRLLDQTPVNDLSISHCILAVEVNHAALDLCRERLWKLFQDKSWNRRAADSLLDRWLVHADFLTLPLAADFSHVVGNPPYIRLEDLPKDLLALYRSQWASLFDRADLYVAFIEKSLALLRSGGRLGFICADRWMKNRYGGPLRGIVSSGYHLESYVDLTGCDAFFSEVDAYPAITVIRQGKGELTFAAFRPEVSESNLAGLTPALLGDTAHPAVSVHSHLVMNEEPWVFDEHGHMAVIRRLERSFPVLEQIGVRVGIGVATGADAVFIGKGLDVEDERKLPLVTTRDIRDGTINWHGQWVLNPFEPDGSLASLHRYPRFARYVEQHRERIEGRNVAKRNPTGWYRTIDRIHETLTHTPKLLIPDIKGSAHVVHDSGHYYPHHNLYHITSNSWDLIALRTVLSSRVAFAFMTAYSPRMRGGHLRFQAQYLRRIRLPAWADVPASLRRALSAEPSRAEAAVRELYRLDETEWALLGEAGSPARIAS